MLVRQSLFRFLFAVVFTGTGFVVHAQLTVAKNVETCLYGLKNATGEWVVPAAYAHITELDGKRYEVSDGTHVGVLGPDGKTVVPVVYDKIVAHKTGYVVTRSEKKGVLRPDGTVLFPENYAEVYHEQYRGVSGDEASDERPPLKFRYYLYETVNDTIRTTMADSGGKVLIDRIAGRLAPFRERSVTALGDYGSRETIGGHARLVRLDGTPARDDMYTAIELRANGFIVSKGEKTGYIDHRNKLLLAPLYEVVFLQPYHHEKPFPTKGGTYLLRDSTGKVGLLDGSFRIVLPVVFDELQELSSYQRSDDAAYLAKRDGKWGVLSAIGMVSVPHLYDKIEVRGMVRNDKWHLEHTLLFCHADGKVAVLDDNGKPWVKGVFDGYGDFGMDNHYFVNEEDCMTLFALSGDSVQTFIPELFARIDTLRIYRWNERLIVLAETADHRLNKHNYSFERIGNFYGVLVYGDLPRRFFLIDQSGQPLEGLYNIGERKGHFAVAYFNPGVGLIDTRTGKQVLDSLVWNIDLSRIADNRIWGQQYDRSGHGKWIVMDTNGHVLTNVRFDQPVLGSGRTPARLDGLAGLLDERLQWVIPPDYKALLPIPDTAVAIFTKGDKFGIITLNGRLIVDTIYTQLTEILQQSVLEENTTATRVAWLFEAPGKQLLYDSHGPPIRSEKPGDAGAQAIERQLVRFAFTEQNAYGHFTIAVPAEEVNAFLATRFCTTAYNWFRERSGSTRSCNFASRQIAEPHYGNVCRPSSGSYRRVAAFGTLFCSLQLTEDRTTYSMEMPIPGSETTSANFVWRNGKTESVSLASVFGNGKWLDKLLIADFRKQYPEACIAGEVTKESMQLSREGIYVFVVGWGSVLIPVAELAKHPESKWIVPLLK